LLLLIAHDFSHPIPGSPLHLSPERALAKAGPEMDVITKMYDLVLWGAKHVGKFPRSHRFTLGDRLEVRLCAVLEMLLRAKYTRDLTLPLDRSQRITGLPGQRS
jgi:hypothetical protein